MAKFIITVSVRFAVNATDCTKAFEIAQEKARELAPVVGDFGAFETEANEDTPLDWVKGD